MQNFVWTKMGTESGQALPVIVDRKEAERQAGGGVFWWGIGNSLGRSIRECAQRSDDPLPVVFSTMLCEAAEHDKNPTNRWLWGEYEGGFVPPHVLLTSGPGKPPREKKVYYALVCRSFAPIALGDQPFDLSLCQRRDGKPAKPSQQVTRFLRWNPANDHAAGRYTRGFRATIVEPWFVKLTRHRTLTREECEQMDGWKRGEDWLGLVSRIRNRRVIQ